MDNSGEITTQELVQAFSKFGVEITQKEIKECMALHDNDGSGSIDLDEFKKMIQDK